jgi:aryl-alcohol dehydrogenase-like predicted oxidoreductase
MKRGLTGLVSEQSVYNLNNRMVELEVLPSAEHYGLGIIPWSPLGGELLGGVLNKVESGRRASEEVRKKVEEKRSQLEAYESLCDKLGETPAAVALAWLLHNPIVTAPIIGPRNLDQSETAVKAAEIKLDSETLNKVDVIWPVPGGSAPEAYAW